MLFGGIIIGFLLGMVISAKSYDKGKMDAQEYINISTEHINTSTDWITIDTGQLPDDKVRVLCTWKIPGEVVIGWYSSYSGKWYTTSGFEIEIAAWQPLPAPFRAKSSR